MGPLRYRNEDTCLIVDLATGAAHGPEPVAAELSSSAGFALAVLDGMGGHGAGVEAARLGAEALRAALGAAALPAGDAACEERLAAAMSAASSAIFDAGTTHMGLSGMAATATVALLRGDRLHLAHVGDTRAYVLRAGRLVQVTCDDSLVNEARAAGYSEDEIEGLPANVVTRALGLKSSVQAASATITSCAGDVLLLCSDGLTTAVADPVIERTLATLDAPEEACLALLRLALRATSRDNITIVVARPDVEGLRAPTRDDALSTPAPRPLVSR